MTAPADAAREIEEIRDNIGDLVSELDHRRHDVFKVRSLVSEHGLSLALGGLALGGLAAGGVLMARRRCRVRRSLPLRVVRIGQALGRLVDHPERQSRPPQSVGLKIVAAAGAAAASVLARRLMQRLFDDSHPPATH
jgi:hypothetical protein